MDELRDLTPSYYGGKKRVTKPCRGCGLNFLIAPGLVSKYSAHPECRSLSRQKPPPTTKLCKGPLHPEGEELPLASFYLTAKGKPTYFCIDCTKASGAARVAKLKVERLAAPPGPIPDLTPISYPGRRRITKTCSVCGEPFLIAPALADRYQAHRGDCAHRRRVRDAHPVAASTPAKLCPECGEVRPREAFDVYAKGDRLYLTGLCSKHLSDPEVTRRRQIRRRSAVDARRRKVMGLTHDQWVAVLPVLRPDCALCGRNDELCTDHHHGLVRFRDMLCRVDNSMTGLAGDEGWEKAFASSLYLRLHDGGSRPTVEELMALTEKWWPALAERRAEIQTAIASAPEPA